ncbi:glyoxalase [Xylanimonas oleitrophica]|uniref:Glyoxalase n=1 Tax=Xylanimonas oleitrophica TaxID=2607479 RepID=A0A2W5WM58_9MICO|nr:VOC family protein [Xylanimonas oleitrophica]PZR52280.1 glyoxalase [Xylanimonas oleitrophica]
MEQRLSLVTLVVDDLSASRRFYAEGLGWRPEFDDPAEVVMFRVGQHTLLSLWDAERAAEEIGTVTRGGTPPVTLAHNLATREEVDEVLALAARAGAPVVSDAQDRAWGGYSGYFSDLDGFRWEIAWNPGPIGATLIP